MSLVLTSLTGLAAGAGHVFGGPDHLAAVAPMAVEDRGRPWLLGLLWGVGHSGGVWIIALLALVAREAIPLDLVSTWSERMVGLVLIGIGLLGLRRLVHTRVHSHIHDHDGHRHAHIHVHASRPDTSHPVGHQHRHSALGIGALHGLAGSSHLFGVIPALVLPTQGGAISYLVAFGLGSILAMTAFSWVMNALAQRLAGWGTRTYRILLAGSCSLCIVVGCYWCVTTFAAA